MGRRNRDALASGAAKVTGDEFFPKDLCEAWAWGGRVDGSGAGVASSSQRRPFRGFRQAKWLLRRVLSDLRLGIDLTSYFLIVDLVGYRGSTNWKGLLQGTDYSPKPAYFAYRNLCTLFDSETVPAEAPVQVVVAEDVPVVTANFRRKDQSLTAYWTPADLTQDVPLRKVWVTLANPPKSPALLDPLSGQGYRITGFDSLPLADFPLILTEASVIGL